MKPPACGLHVPFPAGLSGAIIEAAAWCDGDTQRGMNGTSEIQAMKVGRWPQTALQQRMLRSRNTLLE